jgi:hypothetical protein
MHYLYSTLLCLLFILDGCFQKANLVQSGDQPVDHQLYDSLLSVHVNESGMVDYTGFIKDSLRLNTYLRNLGSVYPDGKAWSRNERLAYWLNAYNAFTIQLIIRNYPVEGIKEIGSGIQVPFVNTPWQLDFIELKGKDYNLDYIEHSVIRKLFDEPRIHAALVCAAQSCPPLRREAYTAKKLEPQLFDQSKKFVETFRFDPDKNILYVSKILDWYGGDFKDVKSFIRKYYPEELPEDFKIKYQDYDWALNSQ